MNTDTSIATIESMNAVELFQENAIQTLLDSITKEVKSEVVDPSSEKGRDRIKSLAYKVAKSKTAIDTLGKDLVTDWKTKSKEVDAVRKNARDYLDNLKAEVRQPVTDWEEAEKARVDAIKERIDYIHTLSQTCDSYSGLYTLDHLKAAVETLNSMPIDESYQELKSIAQKAKDDALTSLNVGIAVAEEAKAQAIELERLTQEERGREEAEQKRLTEEREAKIAKDAAEKAITDAENKRIAAEKLEQEALAKREADTEHRRKINNQTVAALKQMTDIDDGTATQVVEAVAKNQIPNVRITY